MAFNIVRNVNNSLSTANSNPPEEQLPPSRIATIQPILVICLQQKRPNLHPPPPSNNDDVCSLDELGLLTLMESSSPQKKDLIKPITIT